MPPYQRLLLSILLFIGAWLCLFNAAIRLPINSQDLSDTEGLSVVLLLVIALACLGLPCSALTIAGTILSAITKPTSLIVRRAIFWLSNLLLLLSSIFGILIIGLFVLDTRLSIVGVSLYIGAISLILSATPKRVADKKLQ